MIQRLQPRTLIPEHVPLNPPRQPRVRLVPNELAQRHRKDIVQFLECALLRLGHEEEDHDERDDVEAGVESECAGGREVR